MCERSKRTDAIVESDDDHALLRELVAPIKPRRARAVPEIAAIEVDHDRAFFFRGFRGRPDIQIKAILAHLFDVHARHRWTGLHACRLERGRLQNVCPRRAPAKFADRRRRKGNAAINGEAVFVHALNKSGINTDWTCGCGRQRRPQQEHSAANGGGQNRNDAGKAPPRTRRHTFPLVPLGQDRPRGWSGKDDEPRVSQTKFEETSMDFTIPKEITDLLVRIDDFIDREIMPLQHQDDNDRFFDHRREWARTDFEGGGLPRKDWELLLREMRVRADNAGFLRLALPEEYGGKNIGNLAMAVIREHLAAKGLGLFNDLQNETSVVGNFPQVLMFRDFGTEEQKKTILPAMLEGKARIAFGLTEPKHGSDATWMETRAVKDGAGWRINGEKMWNTGVHVATHDMVFCRTSGNDGEARGLTCLIVPMDAPGVKIEEYMWTFNMPTDHARVSFTNVWVPDGAVFGPVDNGLVLARHFVHENRIRQAASGVGAAQYCINESIDYANTRKPFGKPLSRNQAIQWPLVELQTDAEMTRWLIYRTAWEMDRMTGPEIQLYLSDKVSMCNYRGNRLVCDAADWAMQVHGGWGYSRHKQFEHIYRHHRRYRITEGSEEIQIRNVAGHMFGFIGKNRPRH